MTQNLNLILEDNLLLISSVVIAFLLLVLIAGNTLFPSKKITVSEIWIYPIKSCKGYKVDSATTCKKGFEYDRSFMLVDKDGKFLRQSFPNCSKMALINVELDESKGVLKLDAPNMTTLEVPLKSTQTNIELKCKVWDDEVPCTQVLTEEGNKWFSTFLGIPDVRLVKKQDYFVRYTDRKYATNGQVSFADGFPFLLTSEESLAELNSKLENKITMQRFRPNIIIKSGKPFAEDHWSTIKIGAQKAMFQFAKPCSRCPIPNIDPSTGIPDATNQPTEALRSFRTGKHVGYKQWNNAWFFGQLLDHESCDGDVISVGDEIRVLTANNRFLK